MNPDVLKCSFEKTQAKKKKEMLEQQLAMLDTFLDRNAITKENYDKSVSALVKELKSIDSKYFSNFIKNVKPDNRFVRLYNERGEKPLKKRKGMKNHEKKNLRLQFNYHRLSAWLFSVCHVEKHRTRNLDRYRCIGCWIYYHPIDRKCHI